MAAMLVFLMCPAGIGLALARRRARAVPAAREDVAVRLLRPSADPNGITSRTGPNAGRIRFHPALERAGDRQSSDLAPATFPPRYRLLLHQPSQAKGP